jgi:hypothetical protein
MCGPPAGPWGSIPPPTTAGGGSWTAMARRSCGPESDECRAWPMPPALGRAAGGRLRLGHPGFGPARIAAELARPKWGGIVLSTNGVWRMLGRHGLSTRAKRSGLVAGYAAPPAPERPEPVPGRHLDVDHPASWSSSIVAASAA